MVPGYYRWNSNAVFTIFSNLFSSVSVNSEIKLENNFKLSSGKLSYFYHWTGSINWMKEGEPIGRWFIENLSYDNDSVLLITFGQSGISYSDGTNIYSLGGDTKDNHASFEYFLNIVRSRVRVLFIDYSYILSLGFNWTRSTKICSEVRIIMVIINSNYLITESCYYEIH